MTSCISLAMYNPDVSDNYYHVTNALNTEVSVVLLPEDVPKMQL